MVDLLDIVLFVPGLCFLAIALYGMKRGKAVPPGLIAADFSHLSASLFLADSLSFRVRHYVIM